MAAGACGGVAQVVTGHPLDTVRLRLLECSQSAGRVLTRRMYAGVGAPMAVVPIQNAVVFGCHTSVLQGPNIADYAAAGAVSGVAVSLLTTPVENWKAVRQSRHSAGNRVKWFHGIRWRALHATAFRDSVSFSIYFGVYRALVPEPETASLWQVVFAGAIAGMASWLPAPLDAARIRMYLDPTLTYRDALAQWRTSWVGFRFVMARAALVNAATFLTRHVCLGMD